MMSLAKGPDNEAGTQWPRQIQKCAGITVVIIRCKKSADSQVIPRWRRLPEDHLRAGGLLEQTEKCYRAADQANCIPQPKQPRVTLRKKDDKQDRPQQHRASNDPRGDERVINGAGKNGREVALRDENEKIRVVD